MTDHPSSAGIAGDTVPDTRSTASPGWADRTIGGWRWRIRTDWLAFIESTNAPRWLDLRRDARAELVKTNSLRDVFRVFTDTGALFAKIARPATRWDRLRRLVLGPDCLRECRAAEYAARHGIPTVVPIAAAWTPLKKREPASILITLEMPDARPLDEYWPERKASGAESRSEINRLIDAVAEFLARAHHAGFVHTDLHAGNILVSRASDGGFSVRFVDLQAVSVGRRVSDRRAIRNLAQFGHWFRSNALLTDRMRFLDRYLDWRQRLQPDAGLGSNRRELIARLDGAACAHAASLASKRDRQSLRDGRRFGILQPDRHTKAHVFLWTRQPSPGSGLSTAPLTREWWSARLEETVRTIASAGNDPRHPAGQDVTGAASWPIDSGDHLKVLIVNNVPSGLGDRLRQSLCGSRCMRIWKDGNALLNRGIHATRPLAVCETRKWGVLEHSTVVLEYPESARPLDAFLVSQPQGRSDRAGYRLKAAVAHQLGTLLRHLDEADLALCDMRPGDILICGDLDGGERPVVLLDGRVRVRRIRPGRARANLHVLARLNAHLVAEASSLRSNPHGCPTVSGQITRTDRLRVLKRYLDHLGRPADDWESVWRELA